MVVHLLAKLNDFIRNVVFDSFKSKNAVSINVKLQIVRKER